MGLLPSRVEAAVTPDQPRVLDIDGEDADAAFDALSSETARHIFAALYDQPRTPVEIREEVGTSLQNVHYHLDKLEAAGLIRPAGTGYSEKGNAMTVYAPASEAVVLFAGEESVRARLRRMLRRVGALFVVLMTASLSLHYLLEWLRPDDAPGELATGVATRREDGTTVEAIDVTREVAGLDPAVAFFLGGLVVLLLLSGWWFYRGY